MPQKPTGPIREDGDTQPTEDLLARWRDGDTSAGGILFRRYQPQLRALAHRLFPGPLRRIADEEDLVQDACVEACHSLRRFEYRGDGSFQGWLFAILENQVWNRWRRECAQRRDIRRVIEARYLEGKRWEVISEEFGRSPEAMQMLLLRGLRNLRKAL